MRHGVLQLMRRLPRKQCRFPSTRCSPRRWSSHGPDLTRKWSTPLAKTIATAIEATGPISIAVYMRQCLTSDQGGYYTTPRQDQAVPGKLLGERDTKSVDQFGKRGDFITSPEISQIFGELVGIWFMTEWLAQGSRQHGVQFIEMGPGRGTLMDDILRTVSQFKAFASSIDHVWLVEAGRGLREKQKDLLCGTAAIMKPLNDKSGWECQSTYANIPIRWVEDVALLPRDEAKSSTPFIVAHEFFDALPIHAFESVGPSPEAEHKVELQDSVGAAVERRSSTSKVPQWRELLVTPSKWNPLSAMNDKHTDFTSSGPDFQLTIAKASTPTSLILPAQPRFQRLKSQVGSRVEISPESSRYIRDFAQRIGGPSKAQPSGAALIIDYGPADTIPSNTLRGIRSHQVISPFTLCGLADISADVDFTSLADAALDANESVEVHGPVEQGIWLNQLGIKYRAEQLLRNVQEREKRADIQAGWQRLVEGGPKGMGRAYKVMAVVPVTDGKRRPVGFGGTVPSN